ncbi:MAG: alanine racemase [Acidobacteriota bacterium]
MPTAHPPASPFAPSTAASSTVASDDVRAPAVADALQWVEISETAYAHNLGTFRQRIGPDVELAAVVKADAYGHGRRLIAGLAARHGADSFCVHALDEALDLRAAGFAQDILVMGPVAPGRLDAALAADLRLVLYDRAILARLGQLAAARGVRARVHLKLETGTYRQGVDGAALDDLLDDLARLPAVRLEGAYTHFADIEDTTDHAYAQRQVDRFRAQLARIAAAGFGDVRAHAACSAAALVFPDTHFGMIRLGLGQYGLWPSKETFLAYALETARTGSLHPDRARAALQPVLTWKTRIAQVKDVPAGASIGYGRSYRTTRATRIAVLPVGYRDGYDRRWSNRAHVVIRGRRAPVRGRVCMNLTMVDVTDVPAAAVGDAVTLLGAQEEMAVDAAQLADWAGTIAYEVVARLAPDAPRVCIAASA